jgi:glucokinase
MKASYLLGDIGGTHSRFAWTDESGQLSHIQDIDNGSVSDLPEMLAGYLERLEPRPGAAVLAVAGPVRDQQVTLTNRNWHIRADALAVRFGFAWVRLINDFEALAWGLPAFTAPDLLRIGQAGDSATGTKLVLGPGTGLGVAALVPGRSGWTAVPSEGGHVSFGPATAEEEPVFARLRAERPVSAEWVLSGPGLCRLHAALHPDAPPLPPEAIVQRAAAGEAAAVVTRHWFLRLLGRFSGDAALSFKATGGVYLAGGVAQGFGKDFDAEIFRAAFEAHPPQTPLLATVPTYLITHAHPGLAGCAALALTGGA